jgi:hypothetical protein
MFWLMIFVITAGFIGGWVVQRSEIDKKKLDDDYLRGDQR